MKKCLVAMTTLMLVAVLATGCAQVPSMPTPTSPTPAPSEAPTPTPTGEKANFRLLLSDEVNAIDDFDKLWVTITRIGVHQAGEEDGWIEYDLDSPAEVDLTELIGDNATEIWSGQLDDGDYTKVFIYVEDVTGILNDDDDGETVNVKLPSNKLQISKPFTISDSVVNFVYDITVIKAGESGKYILKPQVAESGANQQFNEISPNGETERHQEQHGKSEEQDELNLEIIEEDVAPGDSITLWVTFEGEDVAGATVEVNSEELDSFTGGDGKITFTIPADADELEIEVKKGELEGELSIELQEQGE